jgi:hypothetical protein
MRWRFVDPARSDEHASRAQALARIDAWWRTFEAMAPEIARIFRRESNLDLPRWMDEHLGAIHPEIMWEYGPGLRGGHRLVMTPEAQRHLRPLVNVILQRAPAIPGWEFYPHRLGESLEQASATVQGRVGQPLDPFRACVVPSDGGVNVTFWSPALDDIGEKQAHAVAFVALESLLGEDCLERFVDEIDVADRPAGPDVALADLRGHVDAAIFQQREQLPSTTFVEAADGRQHWYLIEQKPGKSDDYPRQLDLFLARTAHLPMWQRAHSDRVFSSARYSRCCETFAYVKVDGSQGLDPAGFADKSEIEDALDSALRPDRLGTAIGGGTGLRYSYVDLALTDVDRALPLIREALRRGRAPKRSWVQFFDDDLADEWIGVWEDSPDPPLVPR